MILQKITNTMQNICHHGYAQSECLVHDGERIVDIKTVDLDTKTGNVLVRVEATKDMQYEIHCIKEAKIKVEKTFENLLHELRDKDIVNWWLNGEGYHWEFNEDVRKENITNEDDVYTTDLKLLRKNAETKLWRNFLKNTNWETFNHEELEKVIDVIADIKDSKENRNERF